MEATTKCFPFLIGESREANKVTSDSVLLHDKHLCRGVGPGISWDPVGVEHTFDFFMGLDDAWCMDPRIDRGWTAAAPEDLPDLRHSRIHEGPSYNGPQSRGLYAPGDGSFGGKRF